MAQIKTSKCHWTVGVHDVLTRGRLKKNAITIILERTGGNEGWRRKGQRNFLPEWRLGVNPQCAKDFRTCQKEGKQALEKQWGKGQKKSLGIILDKMCPAIRGDWETLVQVRERSERVLDRGVTVEHELEETKPQCQQAH